jgi:hypothetical protein
MTSYIARHYERSDIFIVRSAYKLALKLEQEREEAGRQQYDGRWKSYDIM